MPQVAAPAGSSAGGSPTTPLSRLSHGFAYYDYAASICQLPPGPTPVLGLGRVIPPQLSPSAAAAMLAATGLPAATRLAGSASAGGRTEAATAGLQPALEPGMCSPAASPRALLPWVPDLTRALTGDGSVVSPLQPARQLTRAVTGCRPSYDVLAASAAEAARRASFSTSGGLHMTAGTSPGLKLVTMPPPTSSLRPPAHPCLAPGLPPPSPGQMAEAQLLLTALAASAKAGARPLTWQ